MDRGDSADCSSESSSSLPKNPCSPLRRDKNKKTDYPDKRNRFQYDSNARDSIIARVTTVALNDHRMNEISLQLPRLWLPNLAIRELDPDEALADINN
jgi:hypothetical protein